jgi:RNase P subunit RPR2
VTQPDFKPITCCHCYRQLALATPYRLLFNQGSYCDEPVALRCSTCGARRFWRPLAQSLDSVVIEVYTEAVVS